MTQIKCQWNVGTQTFLILEQEDENETREHGVILRDQVSDVFDIFQNQKLDLE